MSNLHRIALHWKNFVEKICWNLGKNTSSTPPLNYLMNQSARNPLPIRSNPFTCRVSGKWVVRIFGSRNIYFFLPQPLTSIRAIHFKNYRVLFLYTINNFDDFHEEFYVDERCQYNLLNSDHIMWQRSQIKTSSSFHLSVRRKVSTWFFSPEYVKAL